MICLKKYTSRTGRLWIEVVAKPVLNVLLFVRTEREGDLALHVYAVNAMM